MNNKQKFYITERGNQMIRVFYKPALEMVQSVDIKLLKGENHEEAIKRRFDEFEIQTLQRW